jgi:hypothetical protein
VQTAARPRFRGLRFLSADCWLSLLLVGLAIKLTYDVAAVRDVGPSDEAAYMSAGFAIPHRGLPPAEGCPLYCLWYYLLSFLQPNPLRLFYASYSVLVALLSAGFYLLIRAAGGTRALGLLATFFLLTSGVMEIRPYPAYLALAVLLFAAVLAVRVRRRAWSGAITALALLVGGYIRPEYYTAFLLCCLVCGLAAAWTLWRRPAAWRAVAVPALVVVLAAGLCARFMGAPVAQGGGRAFDAFGQHYAVNVVRARLLDLNPWVHYAGILRADFGDARTFGEALRANPRAVLWHVSQNALSLPRALVGCLVPGLELSPQAFVVACVLLAAAVTLGLVCLGYRLFVRGAEDPGRRGLLLALGIVALLSGPVLSACLLILPRDHYLMPVVLFMLALAAASLARLPGCRWLWQLLDAPPALVALAVLLPLVTPNRAHGWDVQRGLLGHRPKEPLVIIERPIAAALHDLHLAGPVAILDYNGYAGAFYAGLPATAVDVRSKTGDFWRFVRERDVGVVVIDPGLFFDACYRDDPSFRGLVSGDRTEDFRVFPVAITWPPGWPKVPALIAVRKDLLRPATERMPPRR